MQWSENHIYFFNPFHLEQNHIDNSTNTKIYDMMSIPARMGRESHYFSTQRKLGRDGEVDNESTNDAIVLS